MRLVGLDPQASDPTRGGLTLESLYISLDTTTTVEEGKENRVRQPPTDEDERERVPDWLKGEKSRPLSALEALSISENRRMVLLGLPGTGKSTFVRYLALRMAQAETDRSQNIKDLLPGWQGGSVLPVILSLGRMAETIAGDCKQGSAVLIEKYICQSLQDDERTKEFCGCILPELERAGALVLFDGLDEVANLNLRPVVVQAVEDFVQKYGHQPSSRFLITCRTYSYHNDVRWQLTGWPTHELALLNNEKIEYFVNAWHDEHIRIEPARKSDFEHKRKQLLVSLQQDDRRRLYEIAPFPIILTMMAVVHTHYGELPDTRAEVYERCVDLLLVRWELERPVAGQPQKIQKRTIIDELGISRVVLDRALWEIAFKAHEGRSEGGDQKRGPALVTEDLLISVLSAHFQNLDKVKIFQDYCQSSNGLLMLQGSVSVPDAPARRVYAFPHLTFEEYLAARYLVRPNFGRTTRGLVQKSDRWREVVMLLGEYLCFAQGDQERVETLLNALSFEKPPASPEHPDWRAAWYAGDLLTLYRRAFPSQTAPTDEHIRGNLKKLIERAALSPRERASAADTLDELGYQPDDLHTFIQIRSPGEKATKVAPTEEFYIAKYPITNLQYERFLKPENYKDKFLWSGFPKFSEPDKKGNIKADGTWGEEGWDWLKEALKNKNNLVENGVLYPRTWRDPRFGSSRHTAPVVGISWYEVSAFCQWLLKHWEDSELGYVAANHGWQPKEIRLPTEIEWVTAASGEDGNRHAWGVLKNEKEIGRFANTSESGIGRTTPVWMYPQGKSPHKVMDISGNVWEWQANYLDQKNGRLAVRGGSWDLSRGVARVSVRNYDLPNHWYDFFGFRVLAFPK
jgi:formylglycine-generating enzyme required for sulfatase activity